MININITTTRITCHQIWTLEEHFESISSCVVVSYHEVVLDSKVILVFINGATIHPCVWGKCIKEFGDKLWIKIEVCMIYLGV